MVVQKADTAAHRTHPPRTGRVPDREHRAAGFADGHDIADGQRPQLALVIAG
jgi:hypothetical protein